MNCWVSTFFDHDPGPGHTDHTCGPLSNDEHYGVGFAFANLVAMERGVPVTAAADGTVSEIRDRMPDIDWLPGTYSGLIRIIDSENRITDSRTVRIELRWDQPRPGVLVAFALV